MYLQIEGGLRGVSEEELAAIGVWSRVCHGEDATLVVLEPVLDLVVEVTAVYALSAFPLAWNVLKVGSLLTFIENHYDFRGTQAYTTCIKYNYGLMSKQSRNFFKFPTCGIASLRHEPLDVSVKFAAVVISGGGERDEILGRLWGLLAVQLQLKVTHVAVQCHGHGEDEKY